MRIHHIGYLTANIDSSVRQFVKLGYEIEQGKQTDSSRGIHIVFLIHGSYRIELIEPCNTESPMYHLLKRYRNTPYHICYETDDIQREMDGLLDEGYTVFTEMAPAPCIDNRNVVFLIHSDMGIIELLEG